MLTGGGSGLDGMVGAIALGATRSSARSTGRARFPTSSTRRCRRWPGISEGEAEGLRQAFGIETIGDLADNPFVRAAVAIREMAKIAY
ncbi:hypothetical protein GCM10010112_84420 [Actinoplanes lobatus]|uniref:Uncharacterized protein n=1 Tax=Actinoplanes lobatus TaxID=113568 RepID=A0ABQ4AX74_9ACTN|nr:hypothetical protein GCM10010112_84420 [Actinoplanes lobatus]GIE45610.1 hypothetical protein Alo02nite_85080 [Actinoplanes lobatus]